MVLWLGALAAHTPAPGSVLGASMWAHNYPQLQFQGSNTLEEHQVCTHVVHLQTM